MPLYQYQCSACEHAFEKTLKISEMLQPTSEACPSCGTHHTVQKHIFTAPGCGDPVRLGITRPGGDIKEVFAKISERTPKSNLHLKC